MTSVPPRLLLALALLSASAPLAIDFYLPSFPQIGSDLGAAASNVQLTLTAFLIGLALGQIAWGPISDRFGRLKPLLIGSVVAAVAGVLAALAPSVEMLIAARFLQALAAAAGIVMARAIVADVLHGFAAARAMSIMMSISGIAPIVAPVIGGAIAGFVPWRGVLGIVAAIAVLQVVVVLLVIRESLPAERRTTRVEYADLGRLLAKPAFLGYTLTQALTFATLMTYVSSSSFLYQSVIGTSAAVYGIGFAVNAAFLTVAGLVSARLAKRQVHPARIIRSAQPVLAMGAMLVLVVALLPVPKVLILLPILVVTTSVGLIMGNTGALAIEQARPAVGSGSALMGGIMFLGGGLASPLGAVAGEHTAVPLAITMVVTAVLGAVTFSFARRSIARNPESEAVFATAA
ncbi:multidrug effflux MFS transporter [Nocardioides albus]|uniref:DHA1 family bicyclomycin/chloramphenicol resistance-like MFS transporter n=1 Tax=Nocardioides albus TaxID=1841 RepID=A0A7W5A5P2_9ACTN|nr:multidrug effflux MFS transporter [Nocardioides albus]MBB3089925.1 DHA1 family bicyclomycin/chloramphenicol resistance-like MFS transporter [Nocardioides albus]GGU36619.1 Bcr/CflA family drug resistance efflux transporter [Nocardioides albus]